jgi:hypothetical protein
MVIQANIAGWGISRVLMDSSSSTDVSFVNAFDALGKISLPVSFGG